jgi:hypothetical protein
VCLQAKERNKCGTTKAKYGGKWASPFVHPIISKQAQSNYAHDSKYGLPISSFLKIDNQQKIINFWYDL